MRKLLISSSPGCALRFNSLCDGSLTSDGLGTCSTRQETLKSWKHWGLYVSPSRLEKANSSTFGPVSYQTLVESHCCSWLCHPEACYLSHSRSAKFLSSWNHCFTDCLTCLSLQMSVTAVDSDPCRLLVPLCVVFVCSNTLLNFPVWSCSASQSGLQTCFSQQRCLHSWVVLRGALELICLSFHAVLRGQRCATHYKYHKYIVAFGDFFFSRRRWKGSF